MVNLGLGRFMTDTSTAKISRFIPFRKTDVLEMCLHSSSLAEQEVPFRRFYHQLDRLLHYEFLGIIESLKDQYAPVDPDTDTRSSGLEPSATREPFADTLAQLIEQSNYNRISQQEIKQAFEQSSLFNIRLHVDFDDFSEVLLFSRGESVRRESVPRLLGLFPKDVEFVNYDRVVVYIKLRDDYQLVAGESPQCRPGSTLLKLFQDVPRGDLEMLFPNTAVRMRTLDKLLIGIPAVVSGGIVLTTKLGASLALFGSLLGFWVGLSSEPVELTKATAIALLAGFGTLGAYFWKQFSSFKNRKLGFMQALTQNLYFKSLDNNAGVIHRLGSDAQDEECKEALLAYYFLLTSGPMKSQQLDQTIENWFDQQWDCQLDFEIGDALAKIKRLNLIKDDKGLLSAVALPQATAILDQIWDTA
jgi:hypothetical protein